MKKKIIVVITFVVIVISVLVVYCLNTKKIYKDYTNVTEEPIVTWEDNVLVSDEDRLTTIAGQYADELLQYGVVDFTVYETRYYGTTNVQLIYTVGDDTVTLTLASKDDFNTISGYDIFVSNAYEDYVDD